MKNPLPLTLELTARHSTIGAQASRVSTQMCATLQAREVKHDIQRTPVDIVVALDISTSMEGSKLDLCKHALGLLLRQLTPNDSFGLVTFSDRATTVIPAVKVTPFTRDSAMQKIDKLRTRGSTSISAGIKSAAKALYYASRQPNQAQFVILLTDGVANFGIIDSNGLVELTKTWLGAQPNRKAIPLHCFGYGPDHDDELLRELSSVSPGGTYYFIESDAAVVSAFGDALGGMLSVVAQNAVLDITIPTLARAKGVTLLDVYYDNAICIDDWTARVSIGDFYAEESRDILCSFSLCEGALVSPHVEATVSYLDMTQEDSIVSEPSGCCIQRPPTTEISAPNKHVEVQWLRLYIVETMERISTLAREGSLIEARYMASQALEALELAEDEWTAEGVHNESATTATTTTTTTTNDPTICQLKHDLQEARRGTKSQAAYDAFGGSRLTVMTYSHRTQRHMSGGATLGGDVYCSAKNKAHMAQYFVSSTSARYFE